MKTYSGVIAVKIMEWTFITQQLINSVTDKANGEGGVNKSIYVLIPYSNEKKLG
jgi:hypothetical protein